MTSHLPTDVIAMVPVRAGSNRVLNKNTRPFADTNLLQLKLTVLKKLEDISKIVVSTDCEVSANIASKMGVAVQWRDKYFAGSTITNDLHWKHIAETTPGEIVFLAQVTSPLLRISSMRSAIRNFLILDGNDSINSVTTEKKFLWQNGESINYDSNVTPKSQDLPDIVSLNFGISIIARQVMIERKNVVGFNPSFVELDKIESLDVDDYTDFKLAEALYRDLGLSWLLS